MIRLNSIQDSVELNKGLLLRDKLARLAGQYTDEELGVTVLAAPKHMPGTVVRVTYICHFEKKVYYGVFARTIRGEGYVGHPVSSMDKDGNKVNYWSCIANEQVMSQEYLQIDNAKLNAVYDKHKQFDMPISMTLRQYNAIMDKLASIEAKCDALTKLVKPRKSTKKTSTYDRRPKA